MSVSKSTTVIDHDGRAVRLMAESQTMPGGPHLILDIAIHGEKAVGAALDIGDAQHLGEWLVAWAKEQGPECCYCHAQVLRVEAKTIGQEFAHQKCIDDVMKRRGL